MPEIETGETYSKHDTDTLKVTNIASEPRKEIERELTIAQEEKVRLQNFIVSLDAKIIVLQDKLTVLDA